MTCDEFAAHPCDILLVEDDPGDVLMIREALADTGMAVRLHVANDVAMAVDFVHHKGGCAEAPRPCLVVLDVNLPDGSGLDVLAELKDDRDLVTIPVVMMSSADQPRTVRHSYELHANVFVAKPGDFDGFRAAIAKITDCFLRLASLP